MSKEIRKLAAIMFTDMVGYSALSQQNEKLALELLEEHRQILRDIFPDHDGKEIKTIGDAFLVEFSSALEATLCAIQIQETLSQRNNTVQDANKILLRIGIHIGDVVYRGNDLYGDGVNIAARIEPLAQTGGICISEDVARQVQNKIKVQMEKLDKTALKNIAMPVEIYKLILAYEQTVTSQKAMLDKNKIAVLPFDNISSDKETDYFSDGLTEELIMHLSRIKELKVISRTTSMLFKNSKKDITTIGRELNSRNILEGSVRKMGDNLRITAQLIDVETDSHLWAEIYKGKIEDVFDIQEEVSKKIVEALRLTLTPEEKVELSKRSTTSTEAFDYNLRAREFMYNYSKRSLQSSILLFEEAIKLDPRYAIAYAGLGEANAMLELHGKNEKALEKAMEYSLKALMYDSSLSEAYSSLTLVYYAKQNYNEAITAALKAIELDSNNFFAYFMLGRCYHNIDRDMEAVEEFKKSIELNPEYYTTYSYLRMAYQNLGETEKTEETLQKTLNVLPRYLLQHPDDARARMSFAIILAQVQQTEEAKTEALKAIALEPADALMLYNAACFYALIEEKLLALEQLKKAVANGYTNFDHLKHDPDLINIREELEFIELVKGK